MHEFKILQLFVLLSLLNEAKLLSCVNIYKTLHTLYRIVENR